VVVDDIVDNLLLSLETKVPTTRRRRNVERFDALLECRTDTATHVIFVKVLLRCIHVVWLDGPAEVLLCRAAHLDQAWSLRWMILQL